AQWDHLLDDTVGIRLQCYPVLKVTPAGAWIDPEAYHHGEWVTHENFKRWVSNKGGQAWAKPTQAAALESLTIRYQRWAGRLSSDINFFMAASHTLKTIMPEHERNVHDMMQIVLSA